MMKAWKAERCVLLHLLIIVDSKNITVVDGH